MKVMVKGLALLVALLVGGGQTERRVGDGATHHLHRQRLVGAPGAPRQPVQRQTVDELHGDEEAAVRLAELVDLHDIGVVQERRQAGLALEHVDEAGLLRQVRQDALDDAGLVEARGTVLLRQEHLRHAAHPEALGEHVATEPLREPTDGEGVGAATGRAGSRSRGRLRRSLVLVIRSHQGAS